MFAWFSIQCDYESHLENAIFSVYKSTNLLEHICLSHSFSDEEAWTRLTLYRRYAISQGLLQYVGSRWQKLFHWPWRSLWYKEKECRLICSFYFDDISNMLEQKICLGSLDLKLKSKIQSRQLCWTFQMVVKPQYLKICILLTCH